MLVLVKNEIIKLLARRKTLVVLIAFILFAGIMAFGLYQNDKQAKRWDSKEYRIQNIENSLEYMKANKEIIPAHIKDNEKEIEKYKQQMDYQIQELEAELKSIKEEVNNPVDWREKLQAQIVGFENQLKESTTTEAQRSDISIRLKQLKYLQQHDIEPVNDSKFTAVNYITWLSKVLGMIFLVIGLAVFASDMVSGECTPPTLKFLLTQPVSRGKVLFSKFIAVSLVGVILILMVEILFFIGIGIIYGFGALNYPTIVGTIFEYDKAAIVNGGERALKAIAESSYIIPVWIYIIRMLALQAFFIVAATAFIFMVSTLFKSSMVSMALSTVILITVIVLLQAIGSLRKYAAYMFTTYGDVGEVITGNIARALNNPSVTVAFVIFILAIWGIASYLIAHFVFIKKDILI